MVTASTPAGLHAVRLTVQGTLPQHRAVCALTLTLTLNLTLALTLTLTLNLTLNLTLTLTLS
jgi:hypothetical protein